MAEWKTKSQHMSHYNDVAQIYNTCYTNEQNLKLDEAVESLRLERQDSILDLGCGTGLLLPKIQKMASNIVGLDVSLNMLRETENSRKHSQNIHIILADADYTPLRKGCFDVVFAITLAQNMPCPCRTLQEVKRVMKPNASVIVTGLKKCFTENSFLRLLKNAKLKTESLRTNDNLKCFIATCKK